MKKSLIALGCIFAIVFLGCESMKPRAEGGDNELIVIASQENRKELEHILRVVFNDTLFTPQPEPYYQIKFVEPANFHEMKKYVNVIVGAVGSEKRNFGVKLMKQILTAEQYSSSINGNNHMIFAKNVFARNQNYLIINGPTQEKIMTAAKEQGPWLKKQFNDLFLERQGKHLFKAARQTDLEKSLMDKYGWSVKIPWGYTVVRDSAEQGLFWMGRDIPYRWLAVHWEDGFAFSDSASAGEYTRNFPPTYLGDIRYIDYKFKMEPVRFLEWGAWQITGMWEHVKEAQGGPFISYLFYDETTDRTYFIHAMIFYPGQDKYLLLRQVDIVANSFRIKK